MTEIETKALALWNEVLVDRGLAPHPPTTRNNYSVLEAICRAIEAYEADKQAFSDAITGYFGVKPGTTAFVHANFARFVIPKPDPLVEACREAHDKGYHETEVDFAKDLRAALAARGLEIVEKKS